MVSGELLHESQQQRLAFSSRFASRKPQTLCEFQCGRDYTTVTFSPVVSAYILQVITTATISGTLFFYMSRANLNYSGLGKLSCHDPTGMFSGNKRKRDDVHVGGERSYMQISSNSV